VAREPGLAGVPVVGHRPLGEVAALVGLDHDAARAADCTKHEADHDREPGQIPHDGGDHITRASWRQRADPLYTSRMKSLSFLLVTLVACAGTQENVNTPVAPAAGTGGSTAARPAASGDVSFELPAAKIDGVVYEPEAITRPGVPAVDVKRPTTLEKQRALVQSTKDPVVKQAHVAELATMLYRESKANKAKEEEKLKDARQVLRDVAQQVGDKAIDEITLQLLGFYELIVADYDPAERAAAYPAAEKALAKLIEIDPKNKELPTYRTWLAYALLKQFKNAEALAAVGTDKLDDKQPELAYMTAWARFRTGDGAGAWQAITVAAKGWGQNPKHDELERDALLIAGRGGIALDQAQVLLTTVFVPPNAAPAKAKLELQSNLIAKLGLTGYGNAGQWAEGVAALDKAVALGGDTVPPTDRVIIAYQQADFTVRLDTPDAAAKYAKQAIDAIGKCGGKCDNRTTADVALGINLMGRLFHTLYATANDKRYYQPAHDLYEITIPLLADPATKAQATKDAKILETTLKNIKPGTGTHDKGALGTLLGRHNPEVQTCYEAALGGNPKLGGAITLTLESDATGAIKGAATEPAAGQAGLAQIAGCVGEHAKHWMLPKRGMAGTTRIKASYTFAVKK
jgi:tetratricopeptide (TPR) repeat protein